MQQYARLAGFCYLVNVLTGMFSLAYIPGALIAANNPAQTFQNITTENTLFRLSIVTSIFCYLSFFILAMLLYKIFHTANKIYAQVMVLLVVMAVCVSFTTLMDKFSILELTSKRKYMSDLDVEYLQTQVMLHVKQYNWGLTVCELFWGLWLLPFGLLILKSGYIPKVLGLLLILGCIGYLTDAFGSIVFKGFYTTPIANYITLPASVGEIGTSLWLLIFGIKKKNLQINLHKKKMKNRLEDFKVNIRLKLSVLWTALMFCYIYCDYFEMKTPGIINDWISLKSPVGPLSPNLLATFSITTIVPTLMICLSVILKPGLSKWVNIVVATLWSIISFMLLINLIGNAWYRFYVLYQVLEIIAFTAIVWTAWNWPKED